MTLRDVRILDHISEPGHARRIVPIRGPPSADEIRQRRLHHLDTPTDFKSDFESQNHDLFW